MYLKVLCRMPCQASSLSWMLHSRSPTWVLYVTSMTSNKLFSSVTKQNDFRGDRLDIPAKFIDLLPPRGDDRSRLRSVLFFCCRYIGDDLPKPCKARMRVQAPNCLGFCWFLYGMRLVHVLKASSRVKRRVQRIHDCGLL